MLKHHEGCKNYPILEQPPSGGCVLKLSENDVAHEIYVQPPSGGCVLKLSHYVWLNKLNNAAAFGRLCVETTTIMLGYEY